MPAKPAAKTKAAPVAAVSTEPVLPPDNGPNIDHNLPAVTEAWKLLDPEGVTFISLSDSRTFFGALRIYPSDTEWEEKFVPELGSVGELFLTHNTICLLRFLTFSSLAHSHPSPPQFLLQVTQFLLHIIKLKQKHS